MGLSALVLLLSHHFVQRVDVQAGIPQANSVAGGGAFKHRPIAQIFSETQVRLWVGLVPF